MDRAGGGRMADVEAAGSEAMDGACDKGGESERYYYDDSIFCV